MPKILVNGVNLVYEAAGNGPPVIFTPGGWGMRDREALFFAGRFSPHFRTIIWDRRNCGFSDLVIEDATSEWHLWTDDLHALLSELGMSPAYIGGRCAGCVLSLLMAHRYPQDVRGLILQEAPLDDVPGFLGPAAQAHYFTPAEMAEKTGMSGMIESSPKAGTDWLGGWISDSISHDPGNRERLLSYDPTLFAVILRKWGSWFASNRLYLANLTDAEIGRISAPTIVTPGLNVLHPQHTSRSLYKLLPNAKWNERFDNYTPSDIKAMEESTDTSDLSTAASFVLLGPVYEEFIRTVESGNFAADNPVPQ